MSTHDWMTPYYYDTGDFVELRKAYEAIDGDFAVIEDATESRKNPTLWKRMDIDDFLITVGGYTKDEVSDPYLTDELARQEVYNIMRGEFGFMNEARFIEDVKRVWHTPFTYREYTYGTETVRTIVPAALVGDMIRWVRVGSVPSHESLRPLRYITTTSFQYTSPFTYDAETRELRVKGDFRGYRLTSLWVREDPILYPASARFEIADIEQVRKDGEYTIITVTTDTADAVAAMIPTLKKPVVYITIPKDVELKVPMTLDLDGHRLAFWSQAAVGRNAIINIELEAIDSTEHTLTELDDIVEVSVNCQQNISVTVSTQWDYGVSQFDTLVEHIHDRFPAGVRLLLDAYRDVDNLEIGVGTALQITTQQNSEVVFPADYILETPDSPYIGAGVIGIRKQVSLNEVADIPTEEPRHFAVSRVLYVTDHLHEIWYDDYDWADAEDLVKSGYAPMSESLGACSSIANSDASVMPWHLRNYDWYYNNQEEYIIHTNADYSRGRLYSSIGMATGFTALNDVSTLNDNGGNPLYRYLPFVTTDGINDEGLCVNMNVIPTHDFRFQTDQNGTARKLYGRYTESGDPDVKCIALPIVDDYVGTRDDSDNNLSALMVCRHLLDTCGCLDDVRVELSSKNIIPFKTASGHIENLHYMISSSAPQDAGNSVMVVEIENGFLYMIDAVETRVYSNGELISTLPMTLADTVHYNTTDTATEPYAQFVEQQREAGYVCLTNFRYNIGGLTKYACGIERQMMGYGLTLLYDMLHLSLNDTIKAMGGLYYSFAYDLDAERVDEPWYSEFHEDYTALDFNIDTPITSFESSGLKETIMEQFANRSREAGDTWHTMHSVLYDRTKRAMWLCVQERTSQIFYRDIEANTDYGIVMESGATQGDTSPMRIEYDISHNDARFLYDGDTITFNGHNLMMLGAGGGGRHGNNEDT